MHRAGGAIALACALAAPARARDLVILEAGGLRDSGHDVADLVDDFLSQEGVFSGLTLQPSYSATLDYLGIPNAIRMDATAFGTQVVLAIPSTGFSTTFTGTSPDDIENQVEDFFEGDGADELAEFLEETHELTALALLDGNPRSTTALFARSAFDRFGLGAPRTRAGYGRASAAEWGHLDLGVEVGGGAIDIDHFSPLTVVDGAITLGGDFEPGVGVFLSLLGQYRNYDGADIYDVGLELGIPIALLRPGGGNPVRWALTPVVQAGGGASQDLLAGGFMVGGGGVSSFSVNFGPLELAIANELLYYGGVPLGEIGGVEIETELDRLLTRNGAKLALYPLFIPALFLEAGASYTSFLGSDAAVDGYLSPFAGLGVSVFELVRVRLGWESDFGDDYAAHTGRLDVGFAF
jgi:hypothetical protein